LSRNIETQRPRPDLRSAVLIGLVCSYAPLLLVGLLAACDKLRQPYIHLGCNPGGGERGRANHLGSASPFYILLKKG
jgi:hypothetical protein